ncbi:5-hydroxytryptamine receptor 3A-like [Poeciliopsis prolifica]|uniref:5-hydroxytryptamine receptor 3A-like n=1 Tax=Poeciliopsis prolifica TaxID=188132 RepID=UPI002412F44A|nr:5-hydroxytryptamine receptor 3A-like [Poeciliopsis prolifica]
MAALTVTLLALAGVSCSQASDCSYSALLNHLKLDATNSGLQIERPVKNWNTITEVQLEMILDSILDVDEKLQTVTIHIYVRMYWINEHLTWNSSEFCGINILNIPVSMIWVPDIIIQEDASETANSHDHPLVSVCPNGKVSLVKRLQLTYICKLNLFRFPFDSQTCNITFSSLNYNNDLLKLVKSTNDSVLMKLSGLKMLTEGEWKLVNMESISYTSLIQRSSLVYQITLERKPFLYVVNLILPLLFLLILDLASFFVGVSSGEKLSVQLKILLSIFILLPILKDILPSTEDSLPVMAIHCISVFTLVWINVLETMLISLLKDVVCCVGEEQQNAEVIKVKEQEADNRNESTGVSGTDKPEETNSPLDLPGDSRELKFIMDRTKPGPKTPETQKNMQKSNRLRWVQIFDSVFFVLYFATVVFTQAFLFGLWKVYV